MAIANNIPFPKLPDVKTFLINNYTLAPVFFGKSTFIPGYILPSALTLLGWQAATSLRCRWFSSLQMPHIVPTRMQLPWSRKYNFPSPSTHITIISNSTGPSEAQIQLLLQNSLDIVSQGNTSWAQCMYVGLLQ